MTILNTGKTLFIWIYMWTFFVDLKFKKWKIFSLQVYKHIIIHIAGLSRVSVPGGAVQFKMTSAFRVQSVGGKTDTGNTKLVPSKLCFNCSLPARYALPLTLHSHFLMLTGGFLSWHSNPALHHCIPYPISSHSSNIPFISVFWQSFISNVNKIPTCRNPAGWRELPGL